MYLAALGAASSPALLDSTNYEFHQTALHLAVLTDQPQIVRFLILCGATADIRDRNGFTPLHLACSRGKAQCVVELTRTVNECETLELLNRCQTAGIPLRSQPVVHLPDLATMDYDGNW